jgi:hypothetical protein
MQHWNAGTNTATAEQTGRIGPWLFFLPGSVSTDPTTTDTAYFAPHKYGNSFPVWTDAQTNFYVFGSRGCSALYMGHNRFIYGTADLSSQSLVRSDWIYGNVDILVSSIGGNDRPCAGVKPDGTPCIYLVPTDAAKTSPWRRIDLDGTNNTALANPPAGGSTFYDMAGICWDGKDSIYMFQDEDLTGFYRYTISTDTWTTLAVLPGNSTAAACDNYITYIPKTSAVGIANSWTSDRIYYKRGTTVNTYYYTVNSDTWSASIGTGSTFATGSNPVWAGGNYIYAQGAFNAATFRALNLNTDVWSAIDTLPTTSTYASKTIITDSLQNQITVDTAGTTYWLFGDLDKFIAVTKDSSSIYRCFYAGILDSYYSTQRVTTTASASAGTNVSISVSGLFDQFELNQPLYIVDPSSGGKAQRFTYSSSGVNTIVAGSLNQTYTTGSVIGVDPQPVIMLCNNFDAVFPVHGTDGPGAYQATNNSHDFNVLQNLIPTSNSLVDATLPSRRGHYQLWPISVGMWTSQENVQSKTNSLQRMTGWNGNTSPLEARGQLSGMYCVKSATGPNPVSEDEIRIGTDTYIVFKCANLFDSTYWNLSLAIGPK